MSGVRGKAGRLLRRRVSPLRTAAARQLHATAAASKAMPDSLLAAELALDSLVPSRNTTRLRDMLHSRELEFLMEAHSALSGKIVQEAGFQAIWASDLSIAAALGVANGNWATSSQFLEVAEYMHDAVSIPILLDGGAGGDFTEACRLTKKLESRGIAGLALEDRAPGQATSSLDEDGLLALQDTHEFAGKIMACKDSQSDQDFQVIARLEALAAGHDLEEALRRADVYHKAGVDAIICRSTDSTGGEIREFMQEWGDRCPVMIMPTAETGCTDMFVDCGVSGVIWANHNMRSAIQSMQDTTKAIYETKAAPAIRTTVAEVKRLQKTVEDEPKEQEQKIRNLDETEDSRCCPGAFVDTAMAHGTEFFTGVPDSLLKDFCDYTTSNTTSDQHVIAANEGTAVAMASGYHMATGAIPLVYLQNSGLGNIVNPVLSLADPKVYSVPMLIVIGWRGEPGKKDEPQHVVQGRVTPTMLESMGVPYDILPNYNEGMEEAMAKAYAYMRTRSSPYALLVKKNTFDKYTMAPQIESSFDLTREQVLNMICEAFPSSPLITTTGFTSREVFELRESRGEGHSQDFLTVGAMGHCSSIALGAALARGPTENVVAVDGDGAAMMHMGGMVTVGASGAKNFKHVLVNNGMHDSVGGQPTGGFGVDFVAVARACGYAQAISVSTKREIKVALDLLATQDVEGPSFVEIKVNGGSRPDLGRPTTTPVENKEVFMKFMGADSLH